MCSCGNPTPGAPIDPKTKPATEYTTRINKEAVKLYAMDDREDFDEIDRGLIARFPNGVLYGEDGQMIFNETTNRYITEDAPCPDCVNPSLWRQSQLIVSQGLFKVCDHLYQIRSGANITFVDAPEGLVIIDTGIDSHFAKACLKLFRKETGIEKPIVAMIYTHTHFDHFGGVAGIIDAADVASGKLPIIAPGTIDSFNRHALGENVICGNAMSRRMGHTFGLLLPRNERGLVTIGLGPPGTLSKVCTYIGPTDGITRTGERRTLGGWEFEFLYAPDTEAPEEMHIYIPAIRAMTTGENANHSMHNIYTLRGARTRDARNFARYLDETIVRWGAGSDVHFGTHTWPVFGNQKVIEFLEGQRDMYKFMHDQALRLANQGYTPFEAAEVLQLPDAIGKKWYNRQYHGGLHHNVQAVIHKELGFWDGDAASVLPLMKSDNAKRHLALIGRDKVIAEGRKAIAEGDYRWAVQILHHAVWADPEGDTEAKELSADAYEQLGYQQELPQYRAIFLIAAKELRHGVAPGRFATDSMDSILAMPIDLLFDFMAVHLNGPKAAEQDINLRINVSFQPGCDWTMWIRNGVLHAREGQESGVAADLTLAGPKAALIPALIRPGSKPGPEVDVSGDLTALNKLAVVWDNFNPAFNLIFPRTAPAAARGKL